MKLAFLAQQWSQLLKLLQVVIIVRSVKMTGKVQQESGVRKGPGAPSCLFLCNAGRRGLEKSLGLGLTPPLPLSAQRCGHSAQSGCLVLSAVAGF